MRKRTDIFREAYGGRQMVMRLTNQEVADRVGCTRPTIQSWLENIEKAPFGYVMAIAEVLKIPPETLQKIAEVK